MNQIFSVLATLFNKVTATRRFIFCQDDIEAAFITQIKLTWSTGSSIMKWESVVEVLVLTDHL
jgi:hypothetical protein